MPSVTHSVCSNYGNFNARRRISRLHDCCQNTIYTEIIPVPRISATSFVTTFSVRIIVTIGGLHSVDKLTDRLLTVSTDVSQETRPYNLSEFGGNGVSNPTTESMKADISNFVARQEFVIIGEGL